MELFGWEDGDAISILGSRLHICASKSKPSEDGSFNFRSSCSFSHVATLPSFLLFSRIRVEVLTGRLGPALLLLLVFMLPLTAFQSYAGLVSGDSNCWNRSPTL